MTMQIKQGCRQFFRLVEIVSPLLIAVVMAPSLWHGLQWMTNGSNSNVQLARGGILFASMMLVGFLYAWWRGSWVIALAISSWCVFVIFDWFRRGGVADGHPGEVLSICFLPITITYLPVMMGGLGVPTVWAVLFLRRALRDASRLTSRQHG